MQAPPSSLSAPFFFQAEDGIRDAQESRGLGDVYKRQTRCAAVMTLPSFETTTPDPMSPTRPGPSAPPSRARTTTTVGATFPNSSATPCASAEPTTPPPVTPRSDPASSVAPRRSIRGAVRTFGLHPGRAATDEVNAVSYTHLTLPTSDL